jgi:hypothetical protein
MHQSLVSCSRVAPVLASPIGLAVFWNLASSIRLRCTLGIRCGENARRVEAVRQHCVTSSPRLFAFCGMTSSAVDVVRDFVWRGDGKKNRAVSLRCPAKLTRAFVFLHVLMKDSWYHVANGVAKQRDSELSTESNDSTQAPLFDLVCIVWAHIRRYDAIDTVRGLVVTTKRWKKISKLNIS